MFAFVVLALVASASANVYIDSKCPEVKAIDNFNLSSYGNGIWYEIARYPNSAEKNSNCGYAEYFFEGDNFKVKNSYVKDNKKFVIEGIGKLAENAGNSGEIVFSLPYGISGKNIDVHLKVVASDYENYAVSYYCKYDEERMSRQDFAWVFSRSKALSSDMKMKVENIFKESKFLDFSKVVWSDFSDEVCNV